jgi:hypothetical protein
VIGTDGSTALPLSLARTHCSAFALQHAFLAAAIRLNPHLNSNFQPGDGTLGGYKSLLKLAQNHVRKVVPGADLTA